MSGTDAPYLRMTQRDDGKGISRHPRLNVSSGGPNSCSSLSAGRAPRLGAANNYGEPPSPPSSTGS